MIPILCLVQEGGIAPAVSQQLEIRLSDITGKALDTDTQVMWIEVAKGNGFTEGKPSTSSLVSVQSPQALRQDDRIALMSEICDLWMEQTGCSINEIVAAVSDPAS